MAHDYRTLQHWNQWFTQSFLGSYLLQEEQKLFANLLKRHFGKHALLIGVPHQHLLLDSTRAPCHTLLSPLISHGGKKYNQVESDLHELPIMTGSIDLVLLPHTLQFVDNPRQLLAEACRIIKPEGLIAISGFNPYSAWGLKKLMTKEKKAPWSANFIQSQQVRNWLQLAEFALEKQVSAAFRPPLKHAAGFERLHFMETIVGKCFPSFGGIYAVIARAKVIPLTPIKMKWKQQLSKIPISSTISGHIARHG